MTITITSEEELKEVAAELLYVLAHMRHWQIEWNQHYGGMLLQQRKIWEKRADDLLEKLKVTYGENINPKQLKVEIKEA